MIKVFATASLQLIDQLPGFFGKLKEFVGEFSIDGMANNYQNDSIVISFYTDKVKFAEGEERLVCLECKNENGEWNFTNINK